MNSDPLKKSSEYYLSLLRDTKTIDHRAFDCMFSLPNLVKYAEIPWSTEKSTKLVNEFMPIYEDFLRKYQEIHQ